MCGFCGFISISFRRNESRSNIVEMMAQNLIHRGPDAGGVWVNDGGNVALGHRRLAIVDLSSAGHQPMSSPCGRYTLVYNGELYNNVELRLALESEGGNFVWAGHSDTETLLAGLRHWGVENTLKKLNGMFAFALWDQAEQSLYLARDRVGEKPLYYGCNGNTFLFGSELKSLTSFPAWRGKVDLEALTLYLRFNYVPAPWSIYEGIKKLQPAHYVIVRQNGKNISEPRCYWELGKIGKMGGGEVNPDQDSLVDRLDNLLRDSVVRRMVADVPLGAFLSGGLDSTTVVAAMQAQSSRPVRTFSIGFLEAEYNEAEHAKVVASYLGTDHTELYVSPDEARAMIPEIPSIWDEPFSDPSQIPTYLLCKLASRNVTVSLSGDGGDELFFGYRRYLGGQRFAKFYAAVPGSVMSFLAKGLSCIPVTSTNWFGEKMPRFLGMKALGDRLRKLGYIIDATSPEDFYRNLLSTWRMPNQLVRGGCEPATIFTDQARWPVFHSIDERMMYFDIMTYLPDDILTKVDRASMAVSLEARVPLLDHRLVEFAQHVPMNFKYRDGQTKWLLRQVLYRYIPKNLMERPKMGFGVPLEHWLRGPLRGWAEALLGENRLREAGFFLPTQIRRMWYEHITGKRRWHRQLWNILMFQAWLERAQKTLHE